MSLTLLIQFIQKKNQTKSNNMHHKLHTSNNKSLNYQLVMFSLFISLFFFAVFINSDAFRKYIK